MCSSVSHILVAVGTTLLVIACAGVGMSLEGQSRVIQGIATGIGFIGAGAILKLSDKQPRRGPQR